MAGEEAMSQKPISDMIQPVGSAITPVGSAVTPARKALGPAVEVLAAGMRINELWVARPEVVSYFESIAADKREIALVHAIEVGITEILVRRRRVRH